MAQLSELRRSAPRLKRGERAYRPILGMRFKVALLTRLLHSYLNSTCLYMLRTRNRGPRHNALLCSSLSAREESRRLKQSKGYSPTRSPLARPLSSLQRPRLVQWYRHGASEPPQTISGPGPSQQQRQRPSATRRPGNYTQTSRPSETTATPRAVSTPSTAPVP